MERVNYSEKVIFFFFFKEVVSTILDVWDISIEGVLSLICAL